jgi:diaminopimelate epimerase
MNDVDVVKKIGQDYFINTGSPHIVRFVTELINYPVFDNGKTIRYRDDFSPGGTNVNFVEITGPNSIFVRTYERGVENETLSCGTGVTAAALAASLYKLSSPVTVKTLGGVLTVEFKTSFPVGQAHRSGQPVGQAVIFEDVYLVGPAKLVFEGDLEL